MVFVERLVRLMDGVKEGSRPVVQGILKNALGKMDLVTREEFDAQSRVLEKAHRTLTELQTRLAVLQKESHPTNT